MRKENNMEERSIIDKEVNLMQLNKKEKERFSKQNYLNNIVDFLIDSILDIDIKKSCFLFIAMLSIALTMIFFLYFGTLKLFKF